MKRISLYLFFLVSIGELVAHVVDVSLLHLVCKPLIMLSLFGFYWFASTERENQRSRSLMLGILFSFFGDVALMGEGELYFMLGLVSFLLAHVAYIFTYRQHRYDSDDGLSGVQRFRFSFPFLLAGTGLVTVLYPHLGDLKVPVMIYALVIVLMVINALFRYGHTTAKSFWLVFVGAILFMISDSLLAFNKFVVPIDEAGFWIMITYIAAQYGIVQGIILHTDVSQG